MGVYLALGILLVLSIAANLYLDLRFKRAGYTHDALRKLV